MNFASNWAARMRQSTLLRETGPIVLLTALWALYFWRVLTPNVPDQVSLPQGDFSGQFLAFGAYQARRLLAGEIPLWNPYNNAGHPFLADTQSAVFYPLRLLTIFGSQFTGGWNYYALQVEVILHYWVVSTLMYAYVRAITGLRLAGIVSAIIIAYGGYLTGYPPLQVAVLEAGVWLPLILLGIHKASASATVGATRWNHRWLSISGLGLGVSLMAGHPQTSLFMIYVVLAYLAYRARQRRTPMLNTALMASLTLGIGFGLAAVQIIPGLEYTALTTRLDIGFDARSNGFPFSDLITFLIPNVFTIWSPLYSGITALALGGIAIYSKRELARFWGWAAIVAMALSFGGATIAYHLAYLGVPGLALFRGQERAAYVVAFSVSILAGLGVAAVQQRWQLSSRARQTGAAIVIICWGLAVEALVARVIFPQADLDALTQWAFFLAILATLNWLLFRAAASGWRAWPAAMVALIFFDLFSVSAKTNWEPVPAGQRNLLSDLVPIVQSDGGLYRVDGRVGLGENYGSLIGLQDIRGTSPLRLKTLQNYLSLPQYRMHQLLSVKYVFTDWTELEVPSTIKAETTIGSARATLRELDDPMPRAWMTHEFRIVSNDFDAIKLLADQNFDPRLTVLLAVDPNLTPLQAPPSYEVAVVSYAPEKITINVSSTQDGVLVISELDYPGWIATVNSKETPILRADGALRAVALKAGEHQVELVFRPLSVALGAGISLIALFVTIGLFFVRKFGSAEEHITES